MKIIEKHERYMCDYLFSFEQDEEYPLTAKHHVEAVFPDTYSFVITVDQKSTYYVAPYDDLNEWLIIDLIDMSGASFNPRKTVFTISEDIEPVTRDGFSQSMALASVIKSICNEHCLRDKNYAY